MREKGLKLFLVLVDAVVGGPGVQALRVQDILVVNPDSRRNERDPENQIPKPKALLVFYVFEFHGEYPGDKCRLLLFSLFLRTGAAPPHVQFHRNLIINGQGQEGRGFNLEIL